VKPCGRASARWVADCARRLCAALAVLQSYRLGGSPACGAAARAMSRGTGMLHKVCSAWRRRQLAAGYRIWLNLVNGRPRPCAAQVADFAADPLNFVGNVRAKTANELLKGFREVQARQGELALPLLALHGTADHITSFPARRRRPGIKAHCVAGRGRVRSVVCSGREDVSICVRAAGFRVLHACRPHAARQPGRGRAADAVCRAVWPRPVLPHRCWSAVRALCINTLKVSGHAQCSFAPAPNVLVCIRACMAARLTQRA